VIPCYSASALDRDKVVCRFDDKETKLYQRKTLTKCRVSGHPPQSVPRNKISCRGWI